MNLKNLQPIIANYLKYNIKIRAVHKKILENN